MYSTNAAVADAIELIQNYFLQHGCVLPLQ